MRSMDIFKAGLLITLCLQALPALAEPCDAGMMPKSLYEKLDKKDYAAAETEARKQVSAHPNDKEAQVNLAKVLINSSLRPVVHMDMQALGIDENKTGVAQQIDMDKLKNAMSDDYVVDAEYGKKAEQQINLVLKRWPDAKPLLYCMTKIHFYSRDHEKFLKSLHRTAEAFSKNEDEAVGFFLDYGQNYFKQNSPELASDVYTTLLKTYPRNAPLLSSLGVSYMYQGRALDAVSLFDKAYKQAPDDEIVIGNIAEVSMLTGDFKKAERFLKLRARHKPEDTSVYFDLAMNAMHKGVKNSLPYWETYFKHNEKHADGENWVHAAKVIQQSIKDGSLTTAEQLNLADQLIEQLRTPKYAIALMSYWQGKDKKDAAFPYQLAHAYDRGKYYDLEERALLETYKRLQKNESKYMELSINEILYNLARTSFTQDRNRDSLKYLDKMKKTAEERANTAYLYGLNYSKLGNKDKAKSAFELCKKSSGSEDLRGSCAAQLKTL